MLQRLFGLFTKSDPKNLLPTTREEPTDDLVIIESNHEFEERLLNIVLDDAEEDINPSSITENNIFSSIESRSTLLMPKPHRQLLWEEKNPKIFAKVIDQSGKIFDVRVVNKGKQLAFWDNKTNTQINVHRNPKDDQVIMHNRCTLKMLK